MSDLPTPANERQGWNHVEILPFYGPAYTAEQMRSHAKAAVSEERERICAALIKLHGDAAGRHNYFLWLANELREGRL